MESLKKIINKCGIYYCFNEPYDWAILAILIIIRIIEILVFENISNNNLIRCKHRRYIELKFKLDQVAQDIFQFYDSILKIIYS